METLSVTTTTKTEFIDITSEVQKVLSEARNVGFNAATGKIEDLVKAGIIDPTKVVRVALQNAASVSTLLLTTDALITELPKEDDEDKN